MERDAVADGTVKGDPGKLKGDPVAGEAPLSGSATGAPVQEPDVETAWVDAHVHIFPPEMIRRRETYLPRDDRFAALYSSPQAKMATTEDVIAEMGAAGVAMSVVFGFPFRDQGLCRLVNDYVLEAVASLPGRLAGLACVSPTQPGAAQEAERCLDAGLRGCGELAPGSTAEGLASLAEVAGLLRERGLPLLLHANEPVGHDYPGKSGFGPAAGAACAAEYPGLKLVFAHMGGGLFLYEAMPELRKVLANSYYDTSAAPYLYDPSVYAAAEATTGTGKLIFGSDYPLLSPARYREGLGALSPRARAAACAGNAREVFGL